jgi:hypothetical protein
MTIFWIGCALAALASLAAWIADYRSTPADKSVCQDRRRLTRSFGFGTMHFDVDRREVHSAIEGDTKN